MHVSAAINHEVVLANHVYTIAPNTQLTIVHGRFRVVERSETPANHKPFDRFLNSLAVNSGTGATAVVLSGYDGDGSLGFSAIKAHGGTTFAQDFSAQVNEMPQHAMETGCVDHVLNPIQIAEQIFLQK